MKAFINSENSIVAYLDILGYSSLVSQNDAPNLTFGAIDSALYRWQENLAQHKYNIGSLVKENVSLDVLSDSFVVVLDQQQILSEFGDDSATRLLILVIFLSLISFLIQDCIREIHYLFRGAIVCGKYYKKEFENLKRNSFIFSEALCKAHKIEQDIADVPRVVIDSSVIGALTDNDVNMLCEGSNPHSQLIQDNDGLHYLSIYSSSITHSSLVDILRAIASIVQFKLENTSDCRVIRKYVWFANYHNSFVAHVIESSAKLPNPCCQEIADSKKKMLIVIPKKVGSRAQLTT